MTNLTEVPINDLELPSYRLYSLLYDNDIKEEQDVTVLSADSDCKSGMIMHLALGEIMSDITESKLDEVAEILQQYAKSTKGKGFCVWSNLNDEQAKEIREFIGESRPVTGFHYDGSLPEVFEKFDVHRLHKTIFSVKEWFETFREQPMTLRQTIDYFSFWVNVLPGQDAIEELPKTDQEVLEKHKEDLFLSMYLTIMAHLTVNDKIILD